MNVRTHRRVGFDGTEEWRRIAVQVAAGNAHQQAQAFLGSSLGRERKPITHLGKGKRNGSPRRRFQQARTHQPGGFGKHHKGDGFGMCQLHERRHQFGKTDLSRTAGDSIKSHHGGEVAGTHQCIKRLDAGNESAIVAA